MVLSYGPFIMVGADGLAVDPEGRLLLCAFGDRALERVEKNGKLSMVVSDMKTVNGLALSPDEKYLYVNGGGENYIRRYDIQPDGALANPKLIIYLSSDKTPGVTDGTKVDSKGNIWTTGPGGVWIISPEGKHLGSILMTERPANLGFGDADLKTLYLTARTSIYRVRVNTPGVPCPACSRSAGTN